MEQNDGAEESKQEQDSKCEKKLSQDITTSTKVVAPRGWNSAWLRSHDWLRFDGTKAWCEPCRKFPLMASKKSALNLKEGYTGEAKGGFKYDAIRNHYLRKGSTELVKEHLNCHNQWKRARQMEESKREETKKSSDQVLDVFIQQGLQQKLQQVTRLCNTAHCVAKKSFGLDAFEDLVVLQLQNGADMGTQYYSPHHTKELMSIISEIEKKDLREDLKVARFLSIMADGSNDKGVIEQEVIRVRYTKKGRAYDKFVSLERVVNGTAKYVLQSILDSLVITGGLTIEDLKKKVVCLNFDGASVMQSSLNGVVGLFKTKVNSDCIFIHCVCHNLELAIGDAYKQDDWLKHCNEVLGSVFKLYYYSPKKYRALKVAAEVLDAKFVHFGGLQNIRWVASQQRAWSALRTNYCNGL